MSTNDLEKDPNYSDGQLIEHLAEEVRAKLDPLPSFKYVVRAYNSRLYSYARKIVVLHENAEEVVQDAFFNAQQAIKMYTPERILNLRLRAWLYRITYNAAMRHLNRNRHRQHNETSLDTSDYADLNRSFYLSDEDLEILVERKEKLEAFKQALKQLSENEQKAVYLHFVQGLNYKEIGLILNLAEGSIKSLISRARNKLRSMLPEYFGRLDDEKGE